MTRTGGHRSAPPVAWTVAGSDPGGGAGIQADLKVFNAFGVHGCSVIAALTAQNTLGVQATGSVPDAMLRGQLDALAADLPPAAIKTGMLGNAANCRVLAEFLNHYLKIRSRPLFVCDPVLRSTSGTDLLDPEALDLFVQAVLPHVDILTPNLPEAVLLSGKALRRTEETAEYLLALGVRSVLLKGGHADGGKCRDYWTDGRNSLWLSSPRIDTHATHGTGCILSAALAAALALGQPSTEALATAKTFLNQCLKSPANVGSGRGPMRIEPFRNAVQDRPTIE